MNPISDSLIGWGAISLLGSACVYAFLMALVRIGRVPMSDAAKAFWLLFVLLVPILGVPLCFIQFNQSDERLTPDQKQDPR